MKTKTNKEQQLLNTLEKQTGVKWEFYEDRNWRKSSRAWDTPELCGRYQLMPENMEHETKFFNWYLENFCQWYPTKEAATAFVLKGFKLFKKPSSLLEVIGKTKDEELLVLMLILDRARVRFRETCSAKNFTAMCKAFMALSNIIADEYSPQRKEYNRRIAKLKNPTREQLDNIQKEINHKYSL